MTIQTNPVASVETLACHRAVQLLCDQVVPERRLLVSTHYFVCPYCGKHWECGGHKEGFSKAGAMRHVFGCWEVLLLENGYLVGNITPGGNEALSVDCAPLKMMRSVKALARSRAKAGLIPVSPANVR